MVFGPTLARAARHDVAPAMVKVWKTFVHQDGMVTRHLSPFEQSIVPPLLKSMPEKALMRFKEHAPYIIPPMLVLVGTIVWMDYEYDQIAKRHRD